MKIFKIDRGATGIRSSFSYYFALVLVSALLCSAQILSTEATNPRGPKQPADINPIGNNGPGQQVNPLQGHFRVTLNGFKVNHQTNQGLWASWDTVTITRHVALVDASGQPHLVNWGTSDDRIGATPQSRLHGGSATTSGGLQTRDNFPTASPWRLNSPPVELNGLPPSRYFEDEITQNSNAVVILPDIWVVDPNNRLISRNLDLQGAYHRQIDHDLPVLGRAVARIIRGPQPLALDSYLRPGASMGLNNAVRLPIGVPQDRPIGMQPEREQFGFVPQVLVLTFDSARFIAHKDFGFGMGVVPIRYVDHPSFAGDYTLYVQVDECRPDRFTNRC